MLGRGIALLFHDRGTRRGWEVSVMPLPFLPTWKTRYPLYRRLGGPQGRSGQVRKISPPPGFDSHSVHPVTSCYTDYATRPAKRQILFDKSEVSPYLIVIEWELYSSLMCNYFRSFPVKLLAVRNCEGPSAVRGTHIVTHDKLSLPAVEEINTRNRKSV